GLRPEVGGGHGRGVNLAGRTGKQGTFRRAPRTSRWNAPREVRFGGRRPSTATLSGSIRGSTRHSRPLGNDDVRLQLARCAPQSGARDKGGRSAPTTANASCRRHRPTRSFAIHSIFCQQAQAGRIRAFRRCRTSGGYSHDRGRQRHRGSDALATAQHLQPRGSRLMALTRRELLATLGGSAVLAACSRAPVRFQPGHYHELYKTGGEGDKVLVCMPETKQTLQAWTGLNDELSQEFGVVAVRIEARTDSAIIAEAVKRHKPASIVLMNNPSVSAYRR